MFTHSSGTPEKPLFPLMGFIPIYLIMLKKASRIKRRRKNKTAWTDVKAKLIVLIKGEMTR
jgi:hypothetical protein